MYIYVLLRMTDTMTSQNIDLSSWDTLYIKLPTNFKRRENSLHKFLHYTVQIKWQHSLYHMLSDTAMFVKAESFDICTANFLTLSWSLQNTTETADAIY
jgi:hypothetical protein